MVIDAGTVEVKTRIDTTGLTSGFAAAMRSLTVFNKDFADGLKKTGEAFTALGKAGMVAGTAITASFTAVIVKSLTSYATAESAAHGLSAAIRAVGGDADAITPQIVELGRQLQRTTTIEDDLVVGSAKLAAQLGVMPDDLKDVTTAAAALTGLFKGDMEGATMAVVRALNGSWRGLQQYIPALKTAKTETERMAILQDAIARGMRFNTEEINTLAGAYKQLENVTGDLWEAIGQSLTPAFSELIKLVKPFIEGLTAWIAEHQELAAWIVGIGAAIGVVTTAIFGAVFALGALITAIATLYAVVPELGAIQLAIAAIMAAVVMLVAVVVGAITGITLVWYSFRSAWESNLRGIRTSTTTLWNEIVSVFKMALSAVWEVFKVFVSAFAPAWSMIGKGFFELMVYLKDNWGKVVGFLWDKFRGFVDKMLGGTIGLARAIKVLWDSNLTDWEGAARAYGNTSRRIFTDAIGGTSGVVVNAFHATQTALGELGSDVKAIFGIGGELDEAVLGQMSRDFDSLLAVVKEKFPALYDLLKKIRDAYAGTLPSTPGRTPQLHGFGGGEDGSGGSSARVSADQISALKLLMEERRKLMLASITEESAKKQEVLRQDAERETEAYRATAAENKFTQEEIDAWITARNQRLVLELNQVKTEADAEYFEKLKGLQEDAARKQIDIMENDRSKSVAVRIADLTAFRATLDEKTKAYEAAGEAIVKLQQGLTEAELAAQAALEEERKKLIIAGISDEHAAKLKALEDNARDEIARYAASGATRQQIEEYNAARGQRFVTEAAVLQEEADAAMAKDRIDLLNANQNITQQMILAELTAYRAGYGERTKAYRVLSDEILKIDTETAAERIKILAEGQELAVKPTTAVPQYELRITDLRAYSEELRRTLGERSDRYRESIEAVKRLETEKNEFIAAGDRAINDLQLANALEMTEEKYTRDRMAAQQHYDEDLAAFKGTADQKAEYQFQLDRRLTLERSRIAKEEQEASQVATWGKSFADMAKGVTDSLKTGLTDVITESIEAWRDGTTSMKEIWGNFCSAIGETFIKTIVNAAVTAMVQASGIEAGMKSLFSGIFGGSGGTGKESGGGGSGIIGGVAGFLGSLFGSERGNVFSSGNVMAFAGGGVFSTPTVFPMANGGVGLFAERGEEAIMPLSRGSDGKLGVVATGGAGGPQVQHNYFINDKAVTPETFQSHLARSQPTVSAMLSREMKNGGPMLDSVRGAR